MLDRWLLSELNPLVGNGRRGDGAFDTQEAGKLLSAFVDDLSNWYVRRSRRRFWRGDPAALATLHEVLTTVTLLMAPLTPFITERVWQDLVVPVDPDGAAVGAPGRLAGGRRVADRPGAVRRRWRWCAGWSSWAARPAPSPA